VFFFKLVLLVPMVGVGETEKSPYESNTYRLFWGRILGILQQLRPGVLILAHIPNGIGGYIPNGIYGHIPNGIGGYPKWDRWLD